MRIMNRLLVVQNQKLVALTVELSERTVEAHLNLIRRKMRERFTLGAALKFQRWRLEQQEQARNAAPLNNIRALTEPA